MPLLPVMFSLTIDEIRVNNLFKDDNSLM